ncbi:beta alanine--pyruvate transaminase [Acetobacter tropicalis NRIC 0312]|uniref:Aspartate aminotransferase family protein n=1 Tax=Acetobacter tropicalis TaxID=104102 RepID=A0A511FQP9_9PROT|nr:aspartate aminotransferase family protein [Acetobacter tropicalis]KXV50313.1 omega amino acid--pyruvate aminotransferase [Acetobacter tropicalis]GAL97208.1 omega amino acid-pyruvate aminotransferase [Acetobacter tropicalis]GBR69362.1 beta alanine--pyruvate transaminase [Acetobacter tropicalis NRIC 0312]GEL51278.1 aspartate aminotransferase family protein [Acetobacter tropicalis]
MPNVTGNFDPVVTAKKGTYWQPFTASRVLQANPAPRTLVSAKGAYYQTLDGHSVFDTLSGLWCTPLGHAHPLIAEAVKAQVEQLDFAPSFQLTHSGALSLAQRIADMAPEGMNHVFFANSGSEAVDTALKVALGYHRMKGAGNRFRMIGRERGYHGVGFGGMSVGGILSNRKMFAAGMMPGVDHLRHTYEPQHMAFTRGQPIWGAHRAEDLERLVALHDASTIAAVIVEPVQGSTGVIVPPQGYLQRLREICTKHGILLIFDEVITGFGRMGAPFASQRFGVKPDIITFAKAVTNGIVPMGGVIVTDEIYNTFMTGPQNAIEFCHGYTYSGHPLAAAVGHVVLDIIESEGLFERVLALEPVLEDAAHSLKGMVQIVDIRNIGLTAAIELKSAEAGPGVRGAAVFDEALTQGLLLRVTGDIISFGPPFISTEQELKEMMLTLRKVIDTVG